MQAIHLAHQRCTCQSALYDLAMCFSQLLSGADKFNRRHHHMHLHGQHCPEWRRYIPEHGFWQHPEGCFHRQCCRSKGRRRVWRDKHGQHHELNIYWQQSLSSRWCRCVRALEVICLTLYVLSSVSQPFAACHRLSLRFLQLTLSP